jgi:hypothetical protein
MNFRVAFRFSSLVLCQISAQESLNPSTLAEVEKTLPIPSGWHVVAITSPSKVIEGEAKSKIGAKLSLAEASGQIGDSGFQGLHSRDAPNIEQRAAIDDALASQIPPGWRVKGYTAGAILPSTTQPLPVIQTNIPLRSNNDEKNLYVVDSALASPVPLAWNGNGDTGRAAPQATQPIQGIPDNANVAPDDELASLIPPGWHVQGYAAGSAPATSLAPKLRSVAEEQKSESRSVSGFEDGLASQIPPGWKIQQYVNDGSPSASSPAQNDQVNMLTDEAALAGAASTRIPAENFQKSDIVGLTSTHPPSISTPVSPARNESSQHGKMSLEKDRLRKIGPLSTQPQHQASIPEVRRDEARKNTSGTGAKNWTLSSPLPGVFELEKQIDVQNSYDESHMEISVPHEAAVDAMFSYSPSISTIKGDSEYEVENQVPDVSELGHMTSIDCLTETINNGGKPCMSNKESSPMRQPVPDPPVSHAFLGGTKARVKTSQHHTSAPVEKHQEQIVPPPTIELHTRQQERRNRDRVEHLKLQTRQQKRRNRDQIEHLAKASTSKLASETSDNHIARFIDDVVQVLPDWISISGFMREVRQPMGAYGLADGMGVHGSD